MSEESTTPDLVALTRSGVAALNRGDFEAATRLYAPDAVLKLTEMGTSFEGMAAIRGFFEDFVSSFAEYQVELEEILDLGDEVTFGVFVQRGRPADSEGWVEMRFAGVGESAGGVLVRHTWYIDLDEARTAAERLAQASA